MEHAIQDVATCSGFVPLLQKLKDSYGKEERKERMFKVENGPIIQGSTNTQNSKDMSSSAWFQLLINHYSRMKESTTKEKMKTFQMMQK